MIDPFYPKARRHDPDVCKSFGPFALPSETLNASTCFDAHSSGSNLCGYFWGDCCFDSRAGSVWNQRIKQFLLANGVAVISMNPGSYGWNYPSTYWDSDDYGQDRLVLQRLFEQMGDSSSSTSRSGNASSILRHLDRSRVVIRGYSGGAQMVSWLIEKWVERNLTESVNILGGVFLSGGSYMCYDETNPIGVCSTCNASDECDGPTQSCALNKSSPSPCCSYCCPDHFAERFFETHPEKWSQHPPVYLAQLPVGTSVAC